MDHFSNYHLWTGKLNRAAVQVMYNCKSRTFHMHYAGYPEGVGMCKCQAQSNGVSYVYAAYTIKLFDDVCIDVPANLVEISRCADGDFFEFTLITKDTALIDEVAKEAFNLHAYTTYTKAVHPRRTDTDASDIADTADLSAVRMSLV